MSELPPPIPAATLILLRPTADGAPELLMTERTGDMAFAAGALVFPGGRIDADDAVTAERFGTDAARIAAIRETIEEVGLAPGLSPAPTPDQVEALRAGLAGETPFAALLAAQGLGIDADVLTPFARWCPNFRETRRFDTLFLLAEASPNWPAPQVSPGEVVRAFWMRATDILADIAAGRAKAIFPTRRNLERLARFEAIDAARADATLHPVERITPWIETRDGIEMLCIPEDRGYPVTCEPLATARRR